MSGPQRLFPPELGPPYFSSLATPASSVPPKQCKQGFLIQNEVMSHSSNNALILVDRPFSPFFEVVFVVTHRGVSFAHSSLPYADPRLSLSSLV